MTELTFQPPLEPDYTIEELDAILKAYDRIRRWGISEEDAKAAWMKKNDYLQWLKAEARWLDQVNRWLVAERRFHDRERLIEMLPSLPAARGWYKLKAILPNLDGVDRYADLSPARQGQYEMFASGVLGGS